MCMLAAVAVRRTSHHPRRSHAGSIILFELPLLVVPRTVQRWPRLSRSVLGLGVSALEEEMQFARMEARGLARGPR